jgi:hypothetical protein
MPEFRLPDLTQRVSVSGRTGSGKTRFSAHLLSKAAFHKQPFVIVDFKGEELFMLTDSIRELGMHEKLPSKPGVYIIRPGISAESKEALNAWLENVWRKERIGLYFDEFAHVPYRGKLNAIEGILMQGRSKKIPLIACTQRPCHCTRFLFSEADYHCAFNLTLRADQERIEEYIGAKRLVKPFKPFHSGWFDIAQHNYWELLPCPSDDIILGRFEDRLRPQRRFG